ncbi:tyrosine/DOPA decarboxylase [Spatholobus suberectus]|nr:tyrosine/DOPA decarboxylase [Spatholobus suberectus]
MADSTGIETEQQLSLKLVVIKERNNVLFAEAGKDFVDVLFSFLTLPLGTIARLVRKESNMQPIEVGSLSSLYKSVENLDKECLCTDTCKEMLLRPRGSMEAYCKSLKLNIDDTEPPEYFVCNNLVKCRYESPVLLSTFKNKRCRCGNMLDKPISPQSSDVFDGFVKSNSIFMITDDLKVVPYSLNTFFYLFKNCGLENMSSVNEMAVTITKNQVMDLLKGCLSSTTTLTSLFLGKPFVEKFKKVEFPAFDSNANGSSKINVTIMQRKSNGKILFAQGKEDFVDFLFSFLTFPLGGVVHLMEGCSSMGSVDGLYRSIADLDENCWTTKEVKKKLVEPGLAPQFILSNQLLPIHDDFKYLCYTEHSYASKRSGFELRNEPYLTACYLTSEFREVNSFHGTCTALDFVDLKSETGNSKGYVKGPTIYMVTDDLVVTPMSPISVVSLLTSMSIPFSDLEEKEVSIGIKEGISILKASLTSTSALTTAIVETEQQLSLKLVVNKERNEVLFAEAGKDFVDVLFSFLTLPLGTVARLVRKESNMQPIEIGSLSSLYQSVENLDKECLCTDTYKEMLLQPRNSMEAYCKSLKINIDDTEPTEYFVCDNLCDCPYNGQVLISTLKNKRCRCGGMLAKQISPDSSDVFDGFVKSDGSFMITDDLKVVPNSLETFFYLLKNCGIKNKSSVIEMTVTVTKNQVMDLFKSCLFSKTTLTDLFIEKQLFIGSFKRINFPPCGFDANISCKIIVKIMQRKSNGKILFAQGKKDFADFLFNFLTIPLGGVVHLMEGYSSIGSFEGLHKSVVDLDEDYWATKEVKNKLVDALLAPQFKQLYSRSGTCTAVKFVDPISETSENSKGYAKGPTMYIATDDLVVMPMSSVYVLSLLNSMNIPYSDLEEKEVSIGIKEGVSILQASLISTSALTTGLSDLLTKVKEEN